MGNFILIVVQNYASSYLRIQSKGDNKSIKLNFVKFPQKNLFWAIWAILAKLWPKITQTYISESALRIFFSDFAAW